MSRRVFIGSRSGVFGAWVAPAGLDAASADEFSLAFASTFAHMQRVTQGSFFMPIHSSSWEDTANTQSIPYGTTFSKPPIVAASMIATSYQANFKGTIRSQYTDLDSVSHTYVWEGISQYSGGHNNIWGVDVNSAGGRANDLFGSIVFVADVYLDHVVFRCVNMAANAQIRYAIYKPQDI